MNAGAPTAVTGYARVRANMSAGVGRGTDEKYPVFRGSFRQPLDAHRQSPSCFLARQEMNLPAMLSRHMKDGFVERG